jgi:hypothetical protein
VQFDADSQHDPVAVGRCSTAATGAGSDRRPFAGGQSLQHQRMRHGR